MLNNPKVLAASLVLLLGAVAYNVWYFGLRDSGGGGRPQTGPEPGRAPVSAPSSGGDTASPAGGAAASHSLDSALAAAGRGELPLRTAEEMAALRGWLADQPEWGRDPLAPPPAAGRQDEPAAEPAPPPAQPPAWRLGAILLGDRSQAVINGEVYGEGDRIDGGTVAEIRRRSVVIRWRGRNVVLRLREPESGESESGASSREARP